MRFRNRFSCRCIPRLQVSWPLSSAPRLARMPLAFLGMFSSWRSDQFATIEVRPVIPVDEGAVSKKVKRAIMTESITLPPRATEVLAVEGICSSVVIPEGNLLFCSWRRCSSHHHLIRFREALIYSCSPSGFLPNNWRQGGAVMKQLSDIGRWRRVLRSTRSVRGGRSFVSAKQRGGARWCELVAAIDPSYPRSDGRGRPPVGFGAHAADVSFCSRWSNGSDPGVEEAL